MLNDGFDVIVSSPPFESQLTPSRQILNESVRGRNAMLPDKQAAYLFIEQSAACLSANSRLCLIQPQGFLYNRKALEFRKALFQKYQVDTLFDFISIRGLYEGADPKSIAGSLTHSRPGNDNVVAHLTFRRTLSIKERRCFEIDHYDRHRVLQPVAESDHLLWRTNLLGGGRLAEIVRRLTAGPQWRP